MKVGERFIWLSLLTTTIVVLLSAAAVAGGATPLVTATALFWWKWWFVAATLAGLGLYLLGYLAQLVVKQPVGRLLTGLIGIGVLLIAFLANTSSSGVLLGLNLSPGGLWAGFAFGLALLATAVVGLATDRWRWVGRALSLVALAGFAVWLWPRPVEGPDPSQLPEIQPTGERLLLIGIDGASWEYLDPLMEAGQLPNIQGLVEDGIRGPLATLRPTRSPALWTTVVTGKKPKDHGIVGHDVMRPRGDHHSLPAAKSMARGFGLESLEGRLTKRGLIVRSPATSVERRVPALWNISTAYESPLDVVNWWASWPAEAILGRIVTDRTYFWRWAAKGFGDVDQAISFPESLYRELMPMVMRPDQVTLEITRKFMDIDASQFAAMQESTYSHHELLSEFRYYYSMFESHRRISLYLLEKARARDQVPSDLMVIFRLVDVTSHSSLKYSELVEDHLGSSVQDQAQFGGVVTEAYRQVDTAIGELLELFGPGNVVLVSDHGFVLEKRRRQKVYEHRSGPPGMFLASGPAFGSGVAEGLSLFDVLPTLLALKGFPVAIDLERRVPTQVFDQQFLDEHPISTLQTFGTLALDRQVSESAVDEEMMERLEALGYLD